MLWSTNAATVSLPDGSYYEQNQILLPSYLIAPLIDLHCTGHNRMSFRSLSAAGLKVIKVNHLSVSRSRKNLILKT